MTNKKGLTTKMRCDIIQSEIRKERYKPMSEKNKIIDRLVNNRMTNIFSINKKMLETYSIEYLRILDRHFTPKAISKKYSKKFY